MIKSNIPGLFEELSRNIDIFIDTLNTKKLTQMATDKWNVKEVLCHLVFWHENYADNYKAMAEKKVPKLLDKQYYVLNIEGVDAIKKLSKETLIKRLLKANKSLYESIVVHKVPRMTYKKGGRVYETDDFVDMIAKHVKTHTLHVRRAK